MAMRREDGGGTGTRRSGGYVQSWTKPTYGPQVPKVGPFRPEYARSESQQGRPTITSGQDKGRQSRNVSTYSGGGGRSSAPSARSTSTSSGGGSGSGGGTSSYDQQLARARSAANSQARSTANSDIERINATITAKQAQRQSNQTSLDALKTLVDGGLQKARDTTLKSIDDQLKVKMDQLKRTFDEGIAGFREDLRGNEQTEGDASFANLANRARERGDLVTQALSQGAGESDVLKSQLQALRNWSANQGDIARSFFDTRQSINSGISDLNTATQTGMINEENSANASRASTWDDFYDAQSDAYTQMANYDQQNYLLGEEIGAAERQKAESQGLLSWLDAGKNYEDYTAPTMSSTAARAPGQYTSQYAQKAADAAGSTWTNPGVSKETQSWKGEAESTGTLGSSNAANAPGASNRKAPEGANLRRW